MRTLERKLFKHLELAKFITVSSASTFTASFDAIISATHVFRLGITACRFFNSRNGQGFAHLHGNHILSDMYLLKLLAPYLLITNIRWQPVGGRPVFLEGLQRVQEFSFDVCCENGVRALPPRIATPDGQVLVFGVNPP